MTANLFTLNSSKTEFLLIGLYQQLARIHISLKTTLSARFISDEHLAYSDTSVLIYHHSRHPLLPHSFTAGSKLTFSTNPFYHNRLMVSWTTFTYHWTGSLYFQLIFPEVDHFTPISCGPVVPICSKIGSYLLTVTDGRTDRKPVSLHW